MQIATPPALGPQLTAIGIGTLGWADAPMSMASIAKPNNLTVNRELWELVRMRGNVTSTILVLYLQSQMKTLPILYPTSQPLFAGSRFGGLNTIS
jgi:hypothetical protein